MLISIHRLLALGYVFDAPITVQTASGGCSLVAINKYWCNNPRFGGLGVPNAGPELAPVSLGKAGPGRMHIALVDLVVIEGAHGLA